MTSLGSISKWHNYIETIQVECDICYESADIFAGDVYEADDAVRYNEWLVGIQIGNDWHDHICSDCSGELHWCEHCDEAIWCDDALHCGDGVAYCDEDCAEENHRFWGEANPGEPKCTSCEWENPFATTDADAEGVWVLA